MKATIVSFKRGRHVLTGNQAIVEVEGVESKSDAEKLVGKKMKIAFPGKNKTEINGEIRSAHGNTGAVRVLFERGLPGQALGKEVQFA